MSRTKPINPLDIQYLLPCVAREWQVGKILGAACLKTKRVLFIGAAIVGAIDYKRTFAQTFESEENRLEAYSNCHTRSAKRLLRALLANGGECAKSVSIDPLIYQDLSQEYI